MPSHYGLLSNSPYAGFDPERDPFIRSQPNLAQQGLLGQPNELLRGAVSGLLGIPGDIEALGRPFQVIQPKEPVFPTSERIGTLLGANTQAPDFQAGLIGSPDPVDLARAGGRGLLAMTLFHGTPHKFDRFELDKIGTGEGAQAFGHGLYFAENPGVAKSYQAALGRPAATGDAGQDLANYALSAKRGDKDAAVKMIADELAGYEKRGFPSLDDPALQDRFLSGEVSQAEVNKIREQTYRKQYDDALRLLKEDKAVGGGHLYEVEIPDEITDRMLDWDAPLSEQPELMERISDLVDDGTIQSSRVQEIVRGPKIAGGYYEGYEVQRAADVDLFEGDVFFSGTDDSYVLIDPNGEFVRDFGGGIESFDDADDALSGLEDIIGESIERGGFGDTTGKDLYEALQSDLGQGTPEAASRALNEAGIPGIRYKSGQLSGGKGDSSNIVVFNPDDITQVKRDGELVYKTGVGGKSGGLLEKTTIHLNDVDTGKPIPIDSISHNSDLVSVSKSSDEFGESLSIKPKQGYSRSIKDIAQPREGVLYRGMSSDEFAEIQSTGRIQSKGLLNQPSQQGQTVFSPEPGISEGFAIPKDFNDKAYIVAINDPGAKPSVQFLQGTEASVMGGISKDSIIEVYEKIPATISDDGRMSFVYRKVK